MLTCLIGLYNYNKDVNLTHPAAFWKFWSRYQIRPLFYQNYTSYRSLVWRAHCDLQLLSRSLRQSVGSVRPKVRAEACAFRFLQLESTAAGISQSIEAAAIWAIFARESQPDCYDRVHTLFGPFRVTNRRAYESQLTQSPADRHVSTYGDTATPFIPA